MSTTVENPLARALVSPGPPPADATAPLKKRSNLHLSVAFDSAIIVTMSILFAFIVDICYDLIFGTKELFEITPEGDHSILKGGSIGPEGLPVARKTPAAANGFVKVASINSKTVRIAVKQYKSSRQPAPVEIEITDDNIKDVLASSNKPYVRRTLLAFLIPIVCIAILVPTIKYNTRNVGIFDGRMNYKRFIIIGLAAISFALAITTVWAAYFREGQITIRHDPSSSTVRYEHNKEFLTLLLAISALVVVSASIICWVVLGFIWRPSTQSKQ